MVKRGLGRGLEALIPLAPAVETGQQVVELPLESIEANSQQPRHQFDQEKLEELAASIREHGVVQPVVVRPLGNGRYQLVAGERRLRACQALGLGSIPALVREMDSREASEVALIENLQREDLNPLEEAEAYRSLMEQYGLTQEEVARRVAKSRAAVANSVRLLSLPAEVQDALRQGRLTAGHARALLGLGDEEAVREAAARVLAGGLSVRQTEALVRRQARPARRAAPPRRQRAEEKDIQDKLQNWLGTRVRIVPGTRGGRIEISYYGDEDLDRLVGLLLGE